MTKLFLQLDDASRDDLDSQRLVGLSGLVVGAASIDPNRLESLEVPVVAIIEDPESGHPWGRELPGCCSVTDGGLELCARLRDSFPDRSWMPRLSACKPDVLYRMSDYPGEGFKFYAPDTAAIRGYQVLDGNLTLSLHEAMNRIIKYGFDRIWLYAPHAAERGSGLDLDLLERAGRDYRGELWISGGATEVRHLENLANAGGVPAVVIDPLLAMKADSGELLAALAPPKLPPQPIHFEPCNRKADTQG